MGSRHGFAYDYRFSSANLNEVRSLEKRYPVAEGDKSFIVEIRTKFIIIRQNVDEQGVAREIIDSERYDVMDVRLNQLVNGLTNFAYDWLGEYWMSRDEIDLFCITFARQLVTQRACLSHIPLVVHFEVCTVQQEGKSFDAAMERAIRENTLTPLYLWEFQSVVKKPMSSALHDYLAYDVPRIRVEGVDEGLALMRACAICSKRPCIGAQISLLPCGCAFHLHCIIQKLENDNLCSRCHAPAYDRSFLNCLFDESDYPDPH